MPLHLSMLIFIFFFFTSPLLYEDLIMSLFFSNHAESTIKYLTHLHDCTQARFCVGSAFHYSARTMNCWNDPSVVVVVFPLPLLLSVKKAQ